MITKKELKSIGAKIGTILRRISETELYGNMHIIDSPPRRECQYWKYSISVILENQDAILYPVGYMIGEGDYANRDLDINQFFFNNDNLLEEFDILNLNGKLNDIIPLLGRIEELTKLQFGVTIVLDSYLRSKNTWKRSLCEEHILIIHLDEDDILKLGPIQCMQNERNVIRINENNKITSYRIPFDKTNMFDSYAEDEENSCKRLFDYDVALSFAGEDRDYVEKVAEELVSQGIRVFYDKYNQYVLWGKDLYTHLDHIYNKKAKYCILFLSMYYANKIWTNHERKSAQARALEEKGEYLLPVRFDKTEIPGIRPTLGYINANDYSPKELAQIFKDKLDEAQSS